MDYKGVIDVDSGLRGDLATITVRELRAYTTLNVFKELDIHLFLEASHLRFASAIMVEDKGLAAKAKKRRKKAEEPRDSEIAYHLSEAERYHNLASKNKRFIDFANGLRA